MTTFNPDFEADLSDVGKYAINDSVMGSLGQIGLQMPKPPMVYNQTAQQWEQYNGEIPPDLTQLSDDALGELLGKLSVFIGFVGGQVGIAQLQMNESTRQLGFIAAKLRMQYKFEDDGVKKRTEQERKDKMIIDQRYVGADARAVYCEAYYHILTAIAGAAEQNYSAVSRRISQRQGESDRDRRGASVNNFQNPPVFRRPTGM